MEQAKKKVNNELYQQTKTILTWVTFSFKSNVKTALGC